MVWKLKKTSYRFTLVVLASSKNNSSNELGHTVKSNKNGRLFPTTMNNATGKPFDGSTLVRRFTQTWKLMPREDKNTPNNHDMRSKLFSTKIISSLLFSNIAALQKLNVVNRHFTFSKPCNFTNDPNSVLRLLKQCEKS